MAASRIEDALGCALQQSITAPAGGVHAAGTPPQLAAAVRYAVFPGGSRTRPRLCLAVARACGDRDPASADAVAASIELLHCASLVHDDLPCFDDAPVRRGRASVHRAFGERVALLAGDALIVLAFENLARASRADRLGPLLLSLTHAAGLVDGTIAGQAWESEPDVPLAHYHRSKTAALFVAAAVTGAYAGGHDASDSWRPLGERLGEAYQVADDISDVVACADAAGKPVGRDVALGRPSAAIALGVTGAIDRLERLVAQALDTIPSCPGAEDLRAEIVREAERRFTFSREGVRTPR
ncbi:MAG: polyprenyl synthetase family protein [Acidobacteriota bacterium]